MKKLAKIVVYFLMTGLVITGICWAQQARTPAQTMAAKDFYKGKVINFVVGTAPGGGYDTNARLIARYLKQYTGATVAIKYFPKYNFPKYY